MFIWIYLLLEKLEKAHSSRAVCHKAKNEEISTREIVEAAGWKANNMFEGFTISEHLMQNWEQYYIGKSTSRQKVKIDM